MARSPRYCGGGCGRRTERASGVCATCAPPPSVDALTGGRWVRRGLVARWVPDEPEKEAA